MLTWLLLGTVLYLLTAYVPSLFLLTTIGVGGYLGSRDAEPERGPMHGRAKRAVANYVENYPVFMALGVLALVVPEADLAMATMGATLFVIARLVYLPMYLFAVPVLRSAVFTLGWVGMAMMGFALI